MMFDKLYEEVEKYYKSVTSARHGGKINPVLKLTAKMGLDIFLKNIAEESTGLWRYDTEGVPFTYEQWDFTCRNNWIYNRSFPTLYNEKAFYDKREVVIAALMAGRLSVEMADGLLDALSVEDQSYDTRRLYPLHYKEGFFRMLIAWNEKHEKVITFDQGMQIYQEYEERILKDKLACFAEMEKQYREFGSGKIGDEWKKQLDKSYSRCKELADRMRVSEVPLSLLEQDDLQRFLVLSSHFERSLKEVYRGNFAAGDYDRNAQTRKKDERGTVLCRRVIEKAASCVRIEDAVDIFVSEGVPEMGEACWRAVSYILSAYASGKAREYKDSYLHMERRHSGRGRKAKNLSGYRLFETGRPLEKNILSFSLDEEQILEKIDFETGAAYLIEELFSPQARLYYDVFSKSDNDKARRALRGFLNEYADWCEGKAGTGREERIRRPLPFYGWKRGKLIRYALATDGRTPETVNVFLEIAGNSELNLIFPKEALVAKALDYCQRNRKDSPKAVEVIRNMQACLCLLMAKQAVTELESVAVGNYMKSCARNLADCMFYDLKPEGMKGEDGIEFLKIHLCLMVALILCGRLSCLSEGNEEEWDEYFEAILFQLAEIWSPTDYGNAEGRAYESFVDSLWTVIQDGKEGIGENGDDYSVFLYDKVFGESRADHAEAEDKSDCAFCFGHIRELLLLALAAGKKLHFEKYDNDIALRQLYDEWFMVLANVETSALIYGVNELDTMITEHKEFLKRGGTYWIYYGGCRNFSLTHYEQLFSLNHFSGMTEEGRMHQNGSRWEKKGALERAVPMWDELCSNVRTIRRIHYIANLPEKEDPFYKFKFPEHLQEALTELEQIQGIAETGDFPEGLQIPEMYGNYYKVICEEKKRLDQKHPWRSIRE